MGIRGELFSTKFACEGRTYFFNVKENRTGDVFLSIVESKPTEGETFDRRSIIIFGEYIEGFMKALNATLPHMEKSAPKNAVPHRSFPDTRPQTSRSPQSFHKNNESPRIPRLGFSSKDGRAERASPPEPVRRRIVVKRVKKDDTGINT
jgi:hypothetical protein